MDGLQRPRSRHHHPGSALLCHHRSGYRIGWNIEDILISGKRSRPIRLQPYPNQAFFTARDILTVNPTTSGRFPPPADRPSESAQRLDRLQGLRV